MTIRWISTRQNNDICAHLSLLELGMIISSNTKDHLSSVSNPSAYAVNLNYVLSFFYPSLRSFSTSSEILIYEHLIRNDGVK